MRDGPLEDDEIDEKDEDEDDEDEDKPFKTVFLMMEKLLWYL